MKGWKQNIFGMWLPEEAANSRWPSDPFPIENTETGEQVTVIRQMGFSIYSDGKVEIRRDGEQREATWQEAAYIKNRWIEILGPEMAAQIGLEPE